MEVLATSSARHACSVPIAPIARVLRFILQMLEHRVYVDPFFVLNAEVAVSVDLDAIFVQVNLDKILLRRLLERPDNFTVRSLA